MKCRVFTCEHKEDWSDALRRLPTHQRDIYYTPAYYQLFENKGDGQVHCFFFEDEHGNLALYPFLLNSVNELGYDLNDAYFDIQGAYGYNGVISSTNELEFRKQFYTAFNSYCQENNIIAEFTRFHPLLSNEIFAKDHMQCLFDRVTVSVDLKRGYETIKKEYQRSTRKQINRMLRNPAINVSYYDSFTAPLINEMCSIYLESMDRLQAKNELYFSKGFFQALFKVDGLRLIVFETEGKPVSFITFFHYEKNLHGFLGGTRNAYLNLSPFSLLYDYMIQYGVKNKLNYLHVGGGTSHQKDDKLLLYKQHFSQQTNDFYIGKKIHFPKVYDEVIGQWEKRIDNPGLIANKQLLKYRTLDNG